MVGGGWKKVWASAMVLEVLLVSRNSVCVTASKTLRLGMWVLE